MEAHVVCRTAVIARLAKTIQEKDKVINSLVNSLRDLQKEIQEKDPRPNIKLLRRGNNKRRVIIFIRR